MKEVEALTEDLGFMIGFDSQSLLGMDPAQTCSNLNNSSLSIGVRLG